jgi:hypothetical protein
MYKHQKTIELIQKEVSKLPSSMNRTLCAVQLVLEWIPKTTIIVGSVDTVPHIWCVDTKEGYYMDVLSEQFDYPPCLCMPLSSYDMYASYKYRIKPIRYAWHEIFCILNEKTIDFHTIHATLKKKLRWSFTT